MRFSILLAGALSAASVISVSTDSVAGGSSSAAYCTTFADGSGYCDGDYTGFLNDPNPSTYATFQSVGFGSSVSGDFFANYGGAHYSCTTSSTYPALQTIWPMFVSSRSYFLIEWDSQGRCDYGFVNNSSAW